MSTTFLMFIFAKEIFRANNFEAACIGEVEITDWFLEHVSDEADNYWYWEVLIV